MSGLIENYIEELFNEKKVSAPTRKKLWSHYFSKLSEAVDVGYSKKLDFYDEELAESLKLNIAEFSAFKETSFKNELESLLTQDGHLTTKSEFKKKALKISDDYNYRWIETERHQTIANAQSAAKWKDFERNVDLYPNLKIVGVNDSRRRPEHKYFDGVVRPFNDPFWDSHMTPLDWGCRCDVIQTDEDVTEIPGGHQLKIEFENNPGKTGKIFGGSAYEDNLSKDDVKEAKATAKKNYENEVLTKPREKQFKTIFEDKTGGKVNEHLLTTKGDDHKEIVSLSKEFAKKGKRVDILPEINEKEKDARKKIFPKLQSDKSNPDIKVGNTYLDLKRPSAIKNIVGNANKASKQGAVAIISDSKLDKELTGKIMDERAKDIFNDKNYQFDKVYFYKDEKLVEYNRTGGK